MKNIIIVIEKDVEMDEYDEDELKNPAHQIIYKNLYNKICELKDNKQNINDKIRNMYNYIYCC